MEKIIDMKTNYGSSFGDVADETAMKVEDVQLQQRAAQSFDAKHMFLILAADAPRFTVVALSAALAALLRSGRDQTYSPEHSHVMDAPGRALAEVLWLTDSDALGMDAVALATSLGRVIDTGMPDSMPPRRCAISRSSSSRGCSVVRRWWSMLSFPMFGADGRVCHIVLRLEDVSDAMQMQLARAAWLPSVAQSPNAMAAKRSELETIPTVSASLREVQGRVDGLILVAANQQDHAVMGAAFDDCGYRTRWAHSGREALSMFAQDDPNSVLLDLTLPEIDGLSTCLAMRAQSSDAAIICLVARRDATMVDSALLAGADEVIEKPVRPRELMAQLQAAALQQRDIDELRAHCQRLRQQRQRLSRLQLHRERIASYIVHDLKEPLSSIDLRAALLLLNRAIPQDARDSIDRIREQTRSAILQVLNLLDIHTHDGGRLIARYEAVNLAELVQELLADFDARAHRRAVTLRSDIAVTQVIADPDLLRRVLVNLLDNAIRYAPANSEVGISARRIGVAGIELRVLNTGECIPEEMRERIFDAFTQIEPTSARQRSRAGRGLGLAFCKLAVEAQGGKIWVAAVEDKTVFTITLADTH
jgi:two-component system sensor histidine kinase/response regulator